MRSMIHKLIKTEFTSLDCWTPAESDNSFYETIEMVFVDGDCLRHEGILMTIKTIWVEPEKPVYTLWARKDCPFWLEASDEELIDLLRHELLHIEMDRPDADVKFYNECVHRGIPVNLSALRIIYATNLDEKVPREYLDFDLKHFNRCFPEGFKYWSQFLKFNRSSLNLHSIFSAGD